MGKFAADVGGSAEWTLGRRYSTKRAGIQHVGDVPSMRSEDTYRLKLRELSASIRAWSGFIADVARIEIAEDASPWRLRIDPRAPRACPIELLLDDRSPVCDVTLAGETYEGWHLPTLDVVLPLLIAVSEGRVVTRRISSSATGTGLGTATLVTLANGDRLELPGSNFPIANLDAERVEQRDEHFVPYRKPGTAS